MRGPYHALDAEQMTPFLSGVVRTETCLVTHPDGRWHRGALSIDLIPVRVEKKVK